MIKTIFDPSVPPRCEYCLFADLTVSPHVCRKTGKPADAPCRRYQYDPTVRPPQQQQRLPALSAEDFRIE